MREPETRVCLRDNLIRTIIAATLIIVAAIFAGGPYSEPRQENPQNYANSGAYNQKPPETFWEKTTNDPVATFTAVLALFTFILAGVSIIQIYFLTRADETSRIAAEAAKDSAIALIASERAHVIEVISGTDIDSMSAILTNVSGIDSNWVYYTVRMSHCFKNFGKTPATVTAFNIDVIASREQPILAMSVFNEEYGHFYSINKRVLGSGDSTVPINYNHTFGFECGSEESRNAGHFWICGYIRFVDVFENENTRRFMWEYDDLAREFRPVHITKKGGD